jgi:hypothetical protein
VSFGRGDNRSIFGFGLSTIVETDIKREYLRGIGRARIVILTAFDNDRFHPLSLRVTLDR